MDLDVAGLTGGGLEADASNLSQPQRTTALSTKITSVLATSFADSEIRDALRSLDERHVQSTAESRRRLRLDAQKEVIDCNGYIVKDFGQVAERLKRIGRTIASLNECCNELRQNISTAARETGPVLDEASTLLEQKREVETKQRLLEAFSKHFLLSDDELDVLTSSNYAVDDAFFALLTRLKRVHSECQVLLGSEDQQLGLELMEKSTRNLEMAFQKLFRWIQKEFKTLDLENPRMNVSIRRALRVLAERPALFESCLDFFAEARERNLSDAFYAALTGFSTQTDDRSTKPMDYYAHDSQRFVGDMLAWTHSAAVSERESLEVLFIAEGDEMAKGIQAGIESQPWLQDNVQVFDGQKSLERLVNRDLSGVARALRQRIEQVIKSDEDSVLAYQIANLIDFYRMTFVRLLGSDSSVLDTLAALRESAMQQYLLLTKDYASGLPTEISHGPPSDLSPPDFLKDALARLARVLKSYDSSFTTADEREAEFAPTLAASLDAFLEACSLLASSLGQPASDIFQINCLLAARACLAAGAFSAFTSSRRSSLSSSISTARARLTSHQHATLLQDSSLEPLLSALLPFAHSFPSHSSSHSSSPPTSSTPAPAPHLSDILSLPALQPPALRSASQALDDFLPVALMDATEQLRGLADRALAEDITAEAAERFCEDFEVVERVMEGVDEEMRENDREEEEEEEEEEEKKERVELRTLFPRTSAEIRVLLS